MTSDTLSPLAGPPLTIERREEDGTPVITVYLSAVGPIAAKCSDRLALIGALIAGACTADAAFGSDVVSAGHAAAILGSVPVGWAVSRTVLRHLLRSRANIVFKPDRVVLNRPWHGQKTFDSNLDLSFIRVPHVMRDREARWHRWLEDMFGKKWPQRPYKSYYGESEHIDLTYMNQRHRVITVCNKYLPERFQSRLLASKDIAAGHAKGAAGRSVSPDTEWSGVSDTPVTQF